MVPAPEAPPEKSVNRSSWQRSPWQRLGAPLLLGALGLALLAGVPSPCPVAFLLGVPCPSCGLTRAARAALQLDFAGATHVHPLWFVVLPALGAFVAIEVGSYVVRGRAFGLDKRRSVRVVFGTIIVLLVVVWVARFFGAFGGPVPIR